MGTEETDHPTATTAAPTSITTANNNANTATTVTSAINTNTTTNNKIKTNFAESLAQPNQHQHHKNTHNAISDRHKKHKTNGLHHISHKHF
uniref:Uncharacterized protein n=1 Tax=Octopus bimaculoides TaxID=37653 RepID=A0A0L8I8Q2_OCTBM